MLEVLAANELKAQRTLNMVPSENAMAGVAKLPLLLDVHHRYFFNEGRVEDRWHFRGAQDVAELESELVVPLLREMTRARHVTLRPLSGLSAMALTLAALGGPPGSTVVTVPLDLGGHYATPRIAERMGLRVEFLRASDPHTLDLGGSAEVIGRLQPQLVYLDQSNCLFPIDVRPLVEAVREVSPHTFVHVDTSHWLGLVLGGAFRNPLEAGADSFGGSTHKTFPGPQKAIVATDRDDVAELLREAQDFLVSNHHLAASLSLGMALMQFAEFGQDYAARIVGGTRRFGTRLADLGLPMIGARRGFSAGHQLWLDTELLGISAREASERLFAAGIRVNFLPDLPGFGAQQAVRIGLNEAVYRGFETEALDALAEVFASAVKGEVSSRVLAAEVAELRREAAAPPARTGVDGLLLATALELCATTLLEDETDSPQRALSALAAATVGKEPV